MKTLIKKVLREETGESSYLPKGHPIVKIITKIINSNSDYETEVSNFYRGTGEEIKIKYSINKSKVRFLPWGTLEGTIYLNIDGLLMYDGDGWVQLYGFHDIPEYVWDEFYDDVLGYISKFVNITNQYGFTIDITHPTQFD